MKKTLAEGPPHALFSEQSNMRPLLFGSSIFENRTCVKALQPAALIYIPETNNLSRCSATVAGNPQTRMVAKREQRAKKGMGSTTTCGGGGYTPNNRCRPEAPLTSLPKLTPVKNDEHRKGEGERRNKTRLKKKKS